MWKRSELKAQGKAAVQRNYWKAVLMSVISMMFLGGAAIMTASNPEVQQATNEMTGFSGEAILAILLTLGVVFVLIAIVAVLINAIIRNPLEVGIHRFHINAVTGTGNVSDIGYGFDHAYKRNVVALLIRDIYIAIGAILLVVPGIILSYQYRMVPYILADNPDMTRQEAFAASKAMMNGNKWRAFVLDLSFILWDFLGVITFGLVAVFYVNPYKSLTSAALYEALRTK